MNAKQKLERAVTDLNRMIAVHFRNDDHPLVPHFVIHEMDKGYMLKQMSGILTMRICFSDPLSASYLTAHVEGMQHGMLVALDILKGLK